MSRARARIRTTHDDPAVVARALRPDNTPEIETRTEDGRVVTTIERETAGGLATTIDDYVVNLVVATTVVSTANRQTDSNHE